MKNTLKVALSIALVGTILTALPSLASAQDDVTQKHIASLEMSQADVREAVRTLFKNVNVSYSIAPDVQGSITVSLKNINFETALQNILRQVRATYRIEGGVFEIVMRTDNAPLPDSSAAGGQVVQVQGKIIRRIKIRSADPQFIAAMLGANTGSQNYDLAPERSTIDKTQQSGGGQGGGNLGGGSQGGGGGRSGSGSGLGSGSSGSGSGNSGGFGGGFGG